MAREELLIELGHFRNTDKVEHGYMHYYAKYLPLMCRTMLEIGAGSGGSLMMWNDLYGSDCDIHVIDLFKDPQHASRRWCERNEFITHAGDQSDYNFLYTVKEQFELIIDDGSHNSDHQEISFKHLFVNNLVSGGLYVVEDLHCCKDPFYWNTVTKYEDTILWALKNYLATGALNNEYFREAENELYTNLIDRVIVADAGDATEKIAFIWKK